MVLEYDGSCFLKMFYNSAEDIDISVDALHANTFKRINVFKLLFI